MPNPTKTIARGLDKRAAESNPNHIPLANLTGAPSSISSLEALTNELMSKRDKLVNLVASSQKAIADYRVKKSAEFAEIGFLREDGPNGTSIKSDQLGDQKRRQMLDQEVNRYAKQVRSTTQAERAKLYGEIRDSMTKVKATRDSLSDPTAILMRSTRMDPDRATAAAILAHSGPREVEAALQDAVLTGNKALAAAALSRVDSMDKSARDSIRLSRNEVAGAIVGEESNKAKRFLAMLDIAEIDADISWAESEGRRVGNLVTRRGMKQRELAHLLGEPGESGDE